MLNTKNLLEQARSYFTNREYDKALFVYSQVLSLDPANIEYQTYCILCDISSENEEKARNLFEYFNVSKDLDFNNAVEFVQETLETYDNENDKMLNLLKDISDTNVESLNAIEYKDFMKLVEGRGSFKEAYQDIMFSTKVAISSKDDLVDFIDKLIENNFNDTAYSYLDGFNEYFSYDKDLINLYEKLGKKHIDNNSK